MYSRDGADDPSGGVDRQAGGELGVVGVAESFRDAIGECRVVGLDAGVRVPVDDQDVMAVGGEVLDESASEASVAVDDHVGACAVAGRSLEDVVALEDVQQRAQALEDLVRVQDHVGRRGDGDHADEGHEPDDVVVDVREPSAHTTRTPVSSAWRTLATAASTFR